MSEWERVFCHCAQSLAKARTLLAVLSIAAGVFAVGMISSTYFFISHDINPTYVAIHPAHGVITAAPFDEALVEIVERLPGVEEAEGRTALGNMSILAISALASLWPAVNAARLTVRDALAYE